MTTTSCGRQIPIDSRGKLHLYLTSFLVHNMAPLGMAWLGIPIPIHMEYTLIRICNHINKTTYKLNIHITRFSMTPRGVLHIYIFNIITEYIIISHYSVRLNLGIHMKYTYLTGGIAVASINLGEYTQAESYIFS